MTNLNKMENELNVNDNINQAEQSVWVDTIAGNLALSDEMAPAAEALVEKLESVSISEEETLETFFQKFTLSEQEVETLQKTYANDNFPALPSDPNQMAAGWLKIKRQVKAEAIRLKSLPLSEEAYLKKLQGVQTSAAQQLLMECMIGEDLRSIPTQHGLKEGSKLREKDGKKTKKRIEKERYPHLTARQIRDFKHLFLNNVIEAIKYAYEQGQIPTRSLALKKSIKKSAKSTIGDYSSLSKWKAVPESYELQDKVLQLKKPLFATSLFANIGIGTSQLETLNIHCHVANELDENRANAHKKLYPSCEMIQGSIADPLIFQQVLEAHRQAGCQIVYASPPCQQATKYNTSKKKGTVEEAMGFKYTMDFIERAKPNYVVIENVPEWLTSQPEIAKDILKGKTIGEYIAAKLKQLQYNYTIDILNAADYGTAENRKRCIVLACKEELGIWKFPKKFDFCPVLFEVIGDLPSLKPGDTDEKFKWHYALGLKEHEIEFLAHTETATSAWDNPSFYQPKTEAGNHSGAQFAATYKRLDWNKPCNTITGGSGSISDVHSVHPGRPKSDGTYSDCRTLSILEILRIIGLPDDFLEPLKLNLTNGRLNADDEKFIRTVLGEHVCPRLYNALMTTIPTPANDNDEVEKSE